MTRAPKPWVRAAAGALSVLAFPEGPGMAEPDGEKVTIPLSLA